MNRYDDIQIIYSGRRTMSLEIKNDMRIIVRAPFGIPEWEVWRFIEEREAWIEKSLCKMHKRCEDAEEMSPLGTEEIKDLAGEALEYIPPRVAHFASLMGVSYGKITIRNQVSRWGSCSSSGNLNFNCLLMLCTPEIVDYVVVHELCHRKHMNHSPEFWSEVAKYCHDYKAQRKWLKENGDAIIRRMKA